MENAYSCEIQLQGDAIYHTRQMRFNQKYEPRARTAEREAGPKLIRRSTPEAVDKRHGPRLQSLVFILMPQEIEWASF